MPCCWPSVGVPSFTPLIGFGHSVQRGAGQTGGRENERGPGGVALDGSKNFLFRRYLPKAQEMPAWRRWSTSLPPRLEISRGNGGALLLDGRPARKKEAGSSASPSWKAEASIERGLDRKTVRTHFLPP
jgi:hypothetical protein